MLIRNVFARAGAVALLVGIAGGGAAAQDGGSNWQAERAALQATVNQRVNQIIDQEVTKQKVAQFLKFGWPVEPPKERKDEIVKRVDAAVEKAARAKFPDARRQEFAQEAAEKFRVYQEGDLVPEFQLSRPGVNTIVREGRLYQVTEQRIRVGTRWLIPEDLSDEMKARFYDEHSKREIQRYIRVQENEYNEQINSFKKEELAKRLPAALLAGGYFPRGRDNMTSTDPNNWLAKTEIVDMLYAARRNQLEGVIGPKIAKEVFEASGYEFVTENKQWMPRNEAASFRRKLADEAAARRAAAAPDVDIFGGGAPAGGAPAAPVEGVFD